MKKPHIKRKDGWWTTSLDGELIFNDATLEAAFFSAHLVWSLQ